MKKNISITEMPSKQCYEDKIKSMQKMNEDWYRGLPEEEKIKKESMLEIVTGICLKKTNKK